MTGFTEHDAVGLAAEIRAGRISAREAVEASIALVEKLDPDLNAVVGRRFEEALAEVDAGLPDGPFTGVPVVVKSLGADVAGLPTTRGSRLWADAVADRDSELVRRYRAAGMVVLGTTNTPELGKNASTEPALHGPTHNPWRHGRSPGGSSGGSAAAVASGMVPVAHANDGGGSIRIPAAMCGLFGLKPSRGRVSPAPYDTSLANPTSVQHAVSRTVRDSAALLDVAAGHGPGDAFGFDPPAEPFATAVARPREGLRVALLTELVNGPATDPSCVEAARATAAVCERLGHAVEEARPTWDSGEVQAASGLMMGMSLVAAVDERLAELGRDLRPDDVEPFTRVMLDHYRGATAADACRALATAERVGRQVATLLEEYDVLLTPVLCAPTPPLGHLDTQDPPTMYERGVLYSGWTTTFNVTGMPAMSVPSGTDPDGMPIGAHVVAGLGQERLLLGLAGQLEQAAPWPLLAP